MGVKCLAQEHNAVPWPGLEPGTSDPESSALTISLKLKVNKFLHNSQSSCVVVLHYFYSLLFCKKVNW